MKKIKIIALVTIILMLSTVLNVYAADNAEDPTYGVNTPVDGENTPDDGEETPDDGAETPDDGAETPDDGEETPDDGEETPDEGEETPDPDQFSDKGELILTPSATTVKVGETFTITVIAKCEDGVEGFSSILTWDQTKLELTNQKEITDNSAGFSDFIEGTQDFSLVKVAPGVEVNELKVETLHFKVLDSVEVNEELIISFSEIEIDDTNEKVTKIEDKNVKLTVVAEPEPEPEPEDDTIAKKPINEAGLTNYAFVIVLGAIVAIALHTKIRKYKDVK